MKVRLTIMTENDNHIDTDISNEVLEQKIGSAWEYLLNLICEGSDKAIVEKCEVVEK